MVDASTAELLVAVGTFILAGATFWLGWNSREERETARSREIAIGVYNPLRNDFLQWIESELSYQGNLNETWTSLKRSQLQLVARVPKQITEKLDDVESDVKRANVLKGQVTTTVQGLWTKLIPNTNSGSIIHHWLVVGTRGQVRHIDPAIAWRSRKTVKDYVEEYVNKQFPGETWRLELDVTEIPC